jgi:hypothetical protein
MAVTSPMFAFSHGPTLHPRDLDPVAHGEHILETTLGGCIPEFTNIGGRYPLSSPVMAKSSTREAKSPWLMMNLPK